MFEWRMNYEKWLNTIVVCSDIRGVLVDIDARNIGTIRYNSPFGKRMHIRVPMEDVRPERKHEYVAPIDTYDRFEGHE